MKNHKWDHSGKKLSDESQKCLNCRIERYMLGGDFRGWEYFDTQSPIGSQRTTFYNPECNPDRGQTKGFHSDGTYIT